MLERNDFHRGTRPHNILDLNGRPVRIQSENATCVGKYHKRTIPLELDISRCGKVHSQKIHIFDGIKMA